LTNLLLLGCSILVGLSIVEFLGARYYPIDASISQLNRRYIYRYKPNSREIYKFSAANGGGKVLVTINSEGRRGDVVSMKRPRILVYGDSFISSVCCSVKQTFVWQLEQGLRGTLPVDPQAVNCGVSGYGPDQESLLLGDEIDRLKPQLVIVTIYTGNDFGDLMRHKLYKLDEHGQLKDSVYSLDPSLPADPTFSEQGSRFYVVRILQKVLAKFTKKEPHAQSSKSQDWMEKWLNQSQTEYKEYIVNGDNNVWNLFNAHYDADVSLTPGSESSQYKRILMDRVIGKMKQITSARSIPLMLVIIPSPIDAVDDYGFPVDLQKYPDYRRSELTDIIESIARKYELPYVNLFKPFRDHGARPLYYVVDNDHWNPAGQSFAAEVVANYIKQRHLLGGTIGTSSVPHQ